MEISSFKTALMQASKQAEIPFADLGSIALYHAFVLEKGYDLEKVGVTSVFPHANAMVVFAVDYPLRPELSECPEGSGWVTPMAYGYDYHVLLKEKGEQLLKALNYEIGGVSPVFEGVVCVDTSPIVDRLAALSVEGIYQTKSGFVAVPELGTACHIGVLLLKGDNDKVTLIAEKGDSLKYNQLIRDQLSLVHPKCKACGLCIKHCPGQALSESQPLQKERCISYVTQSKDVLSEWQMVTMGNRLYGCDECQICCPLNRSDRRRKESAKNNWISYEALLEMSNKSFSKEYRHMGFSWRGASVLKRNAFIAAKNQNYEMTEKIKNSQYSVLVLLGKEFYNSSCKK